jgi:uncharacterized protein (TIGR00255 family)
MKSMTGYAAARIQNEDLSLTVEIRGVNSRYLDIFVNLPPWMAPLEGELRSLLAARFHRGKIELSLRMKERGRPPRLTLNVDYAAAYAEAWKRLAETLGLEDKPTARALLALEGTVDAENRRDDPSYLEELKAALEPAFAEAVKGFEAEREREGKHTEAHILELLSRMERHREGIAGKALDLEAEWQEGIRKRFEEVLGNMIDEGRILQECASQIVKNSIAEELSRLDSHFKAFRQEVAANPAPGKKLDFLCQEINREINTIGSKTPNLEVSRSVVEMKEALEDVREQLRNVE